MYPFTYHRPRSLPDALALLAADPEAKLLAGGMTLIPSMKHRLAAPSQLIDIAPLPGALPMRSSTTPPPAMR